MSPVRKYFFTFAVQIFGTFFVVVGWILPSPFGSAVTLAHETVGEFQTSLAIITRAILEISPGLRFEFDCVLYTHSRDHEPTVAETGPNPLTVHS